MQLIVRKTLDDGKQVEILGDPITQTINQTPTLLAPNPVRTSFSSATQIISVECAQVKKATTYVLGLQDIDVSALVDATQSHNTRQQLDALKLLDGSYTSVRPTMLARAPNCNDSQVALSENTLQRLSAPTATAFTLDSALKQLTVSWAAPAAATAVASYLCEIYASGNPFVAVKSESVPVAAPQLQHVFDLSQFSPSSASYCVRVRCISSSADYIPSAVCVAPATFRILATPTDLFLTSDPFNATVQANCGVVEGASKYKFVLSVVTDAATEIVASAEGTSNRAVFTLPVHPLQGSNPQLLFSVQCSGDNCLSSTATSQPMPQWMAPMNVGISYEGGQVRVTFKTPPIYANPEGSFMVRVQNTATLAFAELSNRVELVASPLTDVTSVFELSQLALSAGSAYRALVFSIGRTEIASSFGVVSTQTVSTSAPVDIFMYI